ncbi:non-ribosomal peptide synthetase, partial [Methylovulum psychrotolerans]|uniref:non-ribosomal peptide synthetase n=1 Tax=Methylovulum psychrotolerans TaxID=1704499 RepID=UPI001B808B06
AGGAYLPLDPAYPDGRLAYLLEDGQPVALLTQAALRARLQALPGGGLPVIVMDGLSDAAGQGGDDLNPDPQALGLTPEHLAYVIYTSGSTGQPKGVMIEHRNTLNLIAWASTEFSPAQLAQTLFATAINFDLAVFELFVPLSTGACVCLLKDLRGSDSPLDGVTLINTVPSAAKLLLDNRRIPASAKTINLAGEPLTRTLAERLFTDSPAETVVNLYGPTETTTYSTWVAMPKAGGFLSHIGRPIANTQIYILDSHRQPVPLGVTGELYIGGAGVARGYLHRPELTAERFIDNPFRPDGAARLYKTGDIGRWWPDGTIEYLGRNDFQVKLRGFRIELGEIEARLCLCPGIGEAVVIAREDMPGDQRLVAYVVPAAGHSPDPAGLRRQLAVHLADYMLPAAFVSLAALPLTANGKLDRNALPAPEGDTAATRCYEAPQGHTETVIAGLWQELLHLEHVGRQDQFFELGGHSLLAVQLAARLRQTLGVELPLSEVFAHPVLAELALSVAQAAQSLLPPLLPCDRSQPIPLSWAQQRLWFLAKLNPEASAAFHITAGLRLQGKLNKTALKATLDRIVRRHEILRTCFVSVDGQPQQVIAEPGFALWERDLRPPTAGPIDINRLCAEETARPFNLAQGPLIRGQLLQLADDCHILLITQHHIISDGWSFGIIVQEVGALYPAFCQGLADPLPPLAVQYADYAVWQRQWLQGEVLAQHLDFWRQTLSTAPTLLSLPTDKPRPAVRSHAGGNIGFTVSAALSTAVKELADQQNATLFMALLSAWSVLMARLSGQTDIVIGTPAANRPLAELAPLIGFFVNTLALRVPLTNDPTVGELLAQVKDLALQAQAHQAMPFEQIVEALNPERSLGHNPIFQVWLNLNNTPEVASLAFPELDIIGLDVPQHTTQFDLTLSLTVVGKEIVGNLGYSKELFDVPTVQRFIGYFLAILTQMADQPALRISQLELLAPAEQQWLMQLNQTAAAYPTEKSLHGLFEAQAAQTPAVTALMFAGQAMSYAALDAQANQLAHYLQAQGIRAEMPVALCVERSPAMLVGLLGILKAGGVYVPIDPDYPVERIGYILQDTQAPVLLTQQHLRPSLPQNLAALVCLDQPDILAAYPADKLQVPLQPLNLAYIIYTSGSTGQPKGVLVSHRNAVQSTTARFAAYKNPLRAFLLVSPFVFDSSVAGLFWTLSQGACLCLPEPEVAKNPIALAALIAREQISHILALPSFYTALLAQGAEQLQALNTVIVAGETCPVEAVKHHYAQLGHAALYNEYGPTEATVWSSVYAASAADSNRPLPIGKPIANVRLYVLDAGLMRVPVGVTGELYIGGAGISRGYLHRPDLTAERFIPDPFRADGGRLYKTGDLARYQPDGNLEFLGRSDQQVKVRGFRIELGEIEARLAACTGLRDVAVLVREDQPGDKRLVAYLQTADSLPVAQLRGELQAVLPEYMIPSAFVCLSQWPITANGKLDRHALPAPDSTAVALQGYAAPQGAVETALAELWQTLLGISQVGRDDHFFELGGHSLLAITLIEQIQQQGYAADVMSVFTTPVLAEMAASIAETAADREVFSVPPNVIPTDCTVLTPDMLPLVTLSHSELAQITALIPGGAANIADIYPLSPLQEGMVFHHLLATDGDAYLMRLLFRFDQRSRLAAFLEALQTVINRHDILRTAIVWQGLAEPVQVVQRHALLPMTELACSAGEDAMQGLLARTDPGQLRLDLQQAPLFAAYYSADAASGTWLLALLNHHVIRDHITGELVLAEIQALLAGQGGRLTASLPYRNYIAQARAVPVSHHEAYFRQQLAEVTEPTAPFGYLDVQGDGKDSREAQLPLSPALSQAILQCAKQQGVANAVIFHAAWAQVLAGCTGRDDVVFGTVLSGRLQGLGVSDQALGMFMNTLPIRICLAHLTAGQLVQETHRQLTGLLAHEQAPLALAQRCSGVTASLPLFTAVLNYRHSHKAGDEAANAAWQGVELLRAEERTNYPITLSVDDLGESFSLAAQCIGSIDPIRVAAYLEAAISQLTGALLHQLDQPVSQLSILPEPERQQLLYGFNHTATACPQHLCAHQLFERHAARQPDAPALDCAGQTLSYGSLNRQANRAAHALRRLGVRPDGRVAVCAGRGVAAIVGLLAALKAGGAYVPIDPALPDGRLAYLLADSQPVAVLADAAGLARLPEGLGLPVRVLDAAGGLADSDGLGDVVGFGHNIDPAAVGLAPGHLAYVIYTSGSTGQPKGVMNPHRGLCNLVQAQPGLFGIRPGSRVLQFASLGFDASVWEIFTALGNGACLCLADTGALLPGAALAATLVGQGISHALLPPAAVATLPDPSALAGLTLIVGGDVCPPALAQRWAAHVRLFNAYGPTEAAVFVTTHACLSHRAGSVPIGRPIANTQVYILDRHLQAVPPGVAGELYIGGAGVARGYLNRPALTAERFIANPFLKGGDGDAGDSNGNAYPCLYKTGDLGRWLPDGSIAYLGRNDFQVKLRGFRIELGEIEARLCLCPDIREAVVIAREDQPGDRRLVAYLIPETGQVPDPAELRRTLAGQLAEYMLPAAFVSLEQFPLTANGKLDRQALPAPDGGAAARGYEAPQGTTETLIAGLWQELLHLGPVGRHDQFFELGGHSLLAVQLVARLRQTLGVEVPLREVFAHPVLAEFALSVGQTAQSALPPILPCDRSRPIPLAWAQQRLWFLAQLDPAASLAYHLPLGVRLDGRLDRAALSAALDRLIARHEALRTTFSEDDGEPRQHIAPAGCGFCLAEHDLSGLDSAAQAAAVTGHSAAEAETAFDFGHGPLIRGRLLRLAADAHLLLVTQHHIISDGWSVGRLLHEFAALYAAYCQGLPDPLPPLALHYPDYAAWQRQWLQGAALNAQLSHWRQHLDAAPALLALPTDYPRPARQSYHGADWRFRLPPELSRAVSQYGQRHGATLFMTLLTAWAVLLSRLSGQTDVVIGTPIANRRHAELEPLLGFFANTLALRVRLDGDPSADALLAQVKATTLAAYAHQDLPFEQLVEALNPPRSLAHSPVFQVLLSLDNTPGGGLPDLPGLRLSGHGQDRQTTQFDLSLSLAEHGGVLSGTLQYATDLFDAASAERIAGYYQTLLGQLTADGQCPVSRLPLLSAAQRRQLLDTFNATEADYPQHLCVHQLFERQAAQTPTATALNFAGHSLSYAELNRLANRLAHRLLALGVRPDSRVGICAERSLEMVVGLLAILKAGGAYLPLDPAYPDGRLAYLLEDGQPVALL